MNEEIKKILDYIKVWTLKKDLPFIVRLEEHITNLQKENKKLSTILHKIHINGVEEQNTTILDLIKENEELKAEIEEANDNATWWHSRYNAMQNNNKILELRINKAIKKLSASKKHFKTQRENNCITFTIDILKGNSISEHVYKKLNCGDNNERRKRNNNKSIK